MIDGQKFNIYILSISVTDPTSILQKLEFFVNKLMTVFLTFEGRILGFLKILAFQN